MGHPDKPANGDFDTYRVSEGPLTEASFYQRTTINGLTAFKKIFQKSSMHMPTCVYNSIQVL